VGEVVDLPMRNLKLVDNLRIATSQRPWLFVHGLRTLLLVGILVVSIIYQIHLGNFVNAAIWVPVYGVLLINFLLNTVYLLNFERIARQDIWNSVLFGADAVTITLLIYFTGTGQSLFLFLYLVNLLLANLVLPKEGSWLLTIWTSICFSLLLIFSPEVTGQGLYFSLVVNNLAFLAVTILSARVIDQLSQAGAQLQEVHSDLQALQNFNELIVSNITTGIVVISRTGFVQYFNTQASRLLQSDHFSQIKIQEVLPELEWPWATLVESADKSHERRELRLQRPGGKTQILEIVAARFRDTGDRLKGWMILLDDRTEQKRLEDSVAQKEKLAAVGQLAAGIAHEIRNPLASISGSVQMMLANPGEQGEDNLKLMRIVDKEIDRLNGLITEFLDYVRPEQRIRTPIDINSLLEEIVEGVKFNSTLRKDIRTELQLNAKCEILGNRDKLKQAFLNLFINAYQAMDKTDGPELTVQTVDDGNQVVVTLQDNGCGIKPEGLARLFEPFHTTKANGTGLGLAITHKILVAHDAQIHVQSEWGRGARFVIEFPAHRHVHTEDLIPFKRGSSG